MACFFRWCLSYDHTMFVSVRLPGDGNIQHNEPSAMLACFNKSTAADCTAATTVSHLVVGRYAPTPPVTVIRMVDPFLCGDT